MSSQKLKADGTLEDETDVLGRNKIDATQLKTLSFQRPDYESLIESALRQLRTADTNTSNDDVETDMLDDALKRIKQKMQESDEVYNAISSSLVIKQDKIADYVRETETAGSVIKRLLGDEVISAKMVNDLVTSVDSNVRELNNQQKLILTQFDIYGEKMNTRILSKLGLPTKLLRSRINNKRDNFDNSVAGKISKADSHISSKMGKHDEKRKWKKGTTLLYSGMASLVTTFGISLVRSKK